MPVRGQNLCVAYRLVSIFSPHKPKNKQFRFVFDDRQSLSTNDDVLGKCFYCNDPHDVYEPCSSVGCKVLVLSCAECRGRQKSSCCDDCAFRAAGSRERCKCVRDRTRAPVQIS